MKRYLSLFVLILLTSPVFTQIISGPMLGQVELRTANIWLEVAPAVRSVQLVYSAKNKPSVHKTVAYKGTLGNEFNPIQFQIGHLEPNTTYQYSFIVDGKPASGRSGEFTTKELWQWRKPAPDFTFLTGSCAYFNEPVYDRPGKPYGGDSSIFKTMGKEKNSAFMLWLGDNWYYREADYYSSWGLWYRAHRDRSLPILQPLLKAMPNYAIWDDHDYGPNDADKSYTLKEESKKVFQSYWCNPSYGENGQGVYTKMSYGDIDIFMMDDRWFRSGNNILPTIDGKPNPSKRMWGPQEMEWLKNALVFSRATFKIIATGNQTLNPQSSFECLQDYPVEFNELMQFITEQKVNGVLFFTGDRHHSEVIRYDRQGTYPLYDVTSSPFTSGIGKVTGTAEENNPTRMPGTLVEAQNYTRVTVSGAAKARKMNVQFIGIKGQKLGEWTVSETELKATSATKPE